MKVIDKSYLQLAQEVAKLHLQLNEANETIEAIKSGQVDAFVVKGINGHELHILKTPDQTYRIFIGKMSQGAVTLNKEGIVLFSNSQFAKMVGLPLPEVVGKAFAAFVIPDNLFICERLIERGWKEDTLGELSVISSGGSIPVQLSLTTLDLDEGFVLSMILTDLTAQKKIQRLLNVNNVKLSLMNNALEISNHDLLQFASVASHDLQEPLRKIQIFSQLIQDEYSGKLSDEADLYLAKIKSSCVRMRDLIIDILNYSKLSQVDNIFKLTDLNSVIKELLVDFELVIIEKCAQITVGELPSVEVNVGQIRQLFQNIISNALKFVRTGIVPSIQISSKIISQASFDSKEQKNGAFCWISIKDNGIGFDDKYSSNIFELFMRLHAKDKFEGTGIGLSVSKKIIEKHNGLIRAKSHEGVGTEFIIILPILQHQV